MTILQVNDLQVHFQTDEGTVQAVNHVSFDLKAGETLGIVGESGSGKSVTNLALLGLITRPGKVVGGSAMYKDQNLLALNRSQFSKIRGHKIAMIFQDPMTALNPFLTIAEQLTEVTQLHLGHNYKQALDHAVEMLDRVGIPSASKRVTDYPHQFSGGMRQRVMIAMALSCKPDILIADEPTTALDVTIQAQILELMRDMQRSEGTAIIFITHDLGVVANVCHRVLVMYGGKIVEESSVDDLFHNPRHPYTLGLIESVPRWDEGRAGQLVAIDGQPPNLAMLPSGCSFHPRCRFCMDECKTTTPELVTTDQRRLACHVNIDEAKSAT